MVGLATMLGCGDSNSNDNTAPAPSTGGQVQVAPAALYVMSNNGIPNTIAEYRRDANGSLSYVNAFSTGGNGDGTDLEGSHGSLVFQASTNRFYAVNAGSNTISAMVLGTDGSLTVLSTVSSNGTRPVSIAAIGDLVYVLNYGNPGANVPANITGFRLVGSQLQPIANSTQSLSAANPDPAQIGFHPTGTVLVVSERGTDRLTTFQVDSNGVAGTPQPQASNGADPAGFDFNPNGLLVVAEGNNANIGAGSASVYNVGVDGNLVDLTISEPNGQTGTSHARVYTNAPFAFFTNTEADTVSSYGLDGNGDLTLVGNGANAITGFGPTELGISNDALYLYTLNQDADTISSFSIGANGALTPISAPVSVPASAVGLVVR